MKVTEWVVLWLFAIATWGSAADFRAESVGARFGFSTGRTINEAYQWDVYGNWALPWLWNLGRQWDLRPRLDLSAGVLAAKGETSFVGTLGPSLVLCRRPLPVYAVAGVSPTILSRHTFGDADLGSAFQLTTHIGVNFEVSSHLELGYRFQHMSNGGLASPNPGFNLHVFWCGYRF